MTRDLDKNKLQSLSARILWRICRGVGATHIQKQRCLAFSLFLTVTRCTKLLNKYGQPCVIIPQAVILKDQVYMTPLKQCKSLYEWQCVLSSEWRTHNDLYIGVWPHFFDWIAGVAIYAGAWAIDHRNGDVAVNQANSLQHGPLCPTIRNGHVFKGCFTATKIRIITKNRPLWAFQHSHIYFLNKAIHYKCII